MSAPKKHESEADFWRNEVDKAIDYYDACGTPSHVVLRFDCRVSDLRFAVYSQGLFHYRGRLLDIVPVKAKQPKLRDLQSDIEGKR